MGKYIKYVNGAALPVKGKADFLKSWAGAEQISEPEEWIPNLVCVVENAAFDAAGFAFSRSEFEVFRRPDGRYKKWLIVPNAHTYAE